jgi:hypothetical protein
MTPTQATFVDDEGNEYTVIEGQEVINAGTQENPNATVPGMKWARLAVGGNCNYVDADTYKVVSTGRIIRRR